MSTDRELLQRASDWINGAQPALSDNGAALLADIDAHLKEPAQDERKALAEDAARYRLLRDTANWDVLPVDEGADRAEWRCLFHSPYGMRHEADDDLDCALDALAAEQEAQASGRARSPAKTVGYLRRHPEPVQDERKVLIEDCLAALPQPAEVPKP